MKHTYVKLLLTGCIFVAITGCLQAQIINTVAGDGIGPYNGDGILADSGRLYNPSGVAVDAAGNIYIADPGNNRIRKVTAATGLISTIAGSGRDSSSINRTYGGDGGPADSALLWQPSGVALDSAGNIFIADNGNNVIRKIDIRTNIITTVAGWYNGNYSGSNGDGGPADSAFLANPESVAFDKHWNLFIADYEDNLIRKVNMATGIITTVAGNGSSGYTGNGGQATAAELNFPAAVAFDSENNMYIADEYNNVVRKVDVQTGIITTYAGSGGLAGSGYGGYSGDGGPANADTVFLYYAWGVAFDGADNLYIADRVNNVIRKVTRATNIITTVVGTGYNSGGGGGGFSGDGGPADLAELWSPISVTVDNQGSLFFADWVNNRIRKVERLGAPFATALTEAICAGDTFYIGQHAYTQPGHYTDTLTGTGGDSVVTLTLTVNALPVVTLSWNSLIAANDLDLYYTTAGDTFAWWCASHAFPAGFTMTGGNPAGGIYSGIGISNNMFDGFATNSLYFNQIGQAVDTVTYTYTNTNGCSTSVVDSIIIQICEGINTITDDNAISIFPNPATDQLFIKTENIQPVTIIVYDADGRLIYTMPFKPVLDVNELSSGVYFVEVKSNEGVARKRFVKM